MAQALSLEAFNTWWDKAWSVLVWLHSWSSLELELGDWTRDLLRPSQPKPPSQRHVVAAISADPRIQWTAVAGKSQAQDVHRTTAGGPQASPVLLQLLQQQRRHLAPPVTKCQGCRAWLQTHCVHLRAVRPSSQQNNRSVPWVERFSNPRCSGEGDKHVKVKSWERELAEKHIKGEFPVW